MRYLLLLAAGLAAWATPGAQAGEIPLATVVRFNTNCARCHEGQCSGRLSFDLDHTAAANHIRRHAGEVGGEVEKDLHAVLAYMKQHCAYYPMGLAGPPAGRWDGGTLARLRSPGGDSHFVPLGKLAAGAYRVRLRFDRGTEACAQTISSAFDINDHPGLRTDDGNLAFEFRVDETGPHYLRLQTGGKTVLEKLEIQPLDGGNGRK